MDDAELTRRIAATTRFRRLVHLAACASTQDVAAAESDDAAAIFWADHQTAGRGRQQREWHDEPGADLAVTFACRLALPEPALLPAAVPVCALQAVEPFAGRALRLKWPNDVFLDGRKLAGVLIDASGGRYAIGVGVNVNRTRFPRDLDGIATSLAQATGRVTDRCELLLALAQRLDAALAALLCGDTAALEQLFVARLGLVGRRVAVHAGTVHEGRLEQLDLRRLVLDGGRSVPLGIVQGIAVA